ncbi:hypothetical protein [Pseudonocardia humida]|uniref:Membrane protein DUF2207 n=1 Tax=Pseudonocardia humida TaxID=2800819 RepID=A0ABT0ZRV8_9PSEU|nr:hypothetical protein [Pseudonocardia humida]MCO1653446.1 hypothetical protein [Pseudonocardia humida]
MPEPSPAAASRTRRRVPRGARRGVALVATALALLLAVPGTAWAGGPTSVLLVSPTTGRAAGVHTADPVYAELEALLADPGGPISHPPENGPGQYVTATWLVHDVSIWRIDRIFLDRTDGIRVVTRIAGTSEPADMSEGMWPGESGGPDAIWHRPTDQAALVALLDRLGLLDPAVPDPSGDRATVTAAELRAAAAATTPTAPAPEPPPAAGDGPWWWAGAGALLGAAAAVLGLRAWPGLRRRVLPAPVER